MRLLCLTKWGSVSHGQTRRHATGFLPPGWAVHQSGGLVRSPPPSRFWGTSTRRRRSTTTRLPLRKFQVGDEVFWKDSGENESMAQSGTIVEIRRGGWYTLRPEKDKENLVKKRASQLAPSVEAMSKEEDGLQLSLSSFSAPPQPPAPSIVDLDAMLSWPESADAISLQDAQLQKVARLTHNITQWVVFTDLHCSSTTLDTCLQVLNRVHEEAQRRHAGILFLGDFWHHRLTLRVDCLNAIRTALGRWTQPCLMIPGNHDQVSFATQQCHNHALQPLETDRVVVLSQPTLLHGALFVPHIREVAVLESILLATWPSSSSLALLSPDNKKSNKDKIQALFLHADVTGASMNDLMVSQGGIHPSVLPPQVSSIYSGHFHKPHLAGRVRYVGSPYQVSLAEAHQDKALVVVDSTRQWQVVEEIALDLGRRFFHGTSWNELKMWALQRFQASQEDQQGHCHWPRSGDRIVWTLSSDDKVLMQGKQVDQDDETWGVDEILAQLRKDNITVDIREAKSNPFARKPLDKQGDDDASTGMWEDLLSPISVWESFLRSTTTTANGKAEKKDGSSSSSSIEFQELWETGRAILEGGFASTDEETTTTSNEPPTPTTLEIDSVTLQGFGSFRDQVTYPLNNRGLVLLRGNNLDGGSDSNGSGKSTLAMAALWALTGSMDARPVQDGRVSDVVNDERTKAQVTLRGKVNGEEFVVQRTKTAAKSHVLFRIGEKDLTRQSAKETQQALEEELLGGGEHGALSWTASELLTRTMFHGQHALGGLLEATDAQLKNDLSLLLPLDTWQEAASKARSQAKLANKKATELEGKTNLRSQDEETLQQEFNAAQTAFDECSLALEDTMGASEREEEKGSHPLAIDSLQQALQQAQDEWKTATERVQQLESNLTDLSAKRASAVKDAQEGLQNATAAWGEARVHHEGHNQRLVQAQLAHEGALAALEAYVKEWGLVLEKSGDAITILSFAAPDVCPTCHQPLSSGQHDHSNMDMMATLQGQVTQRSTDVASTRAALEEYQGLGEESSRDMTQLELEMTTAQNEVKEIESQWSFDFTNLEKDLGSARERVAAASTGASNAMAALQRQLQEEMRQELERNKRQEEMLRSQQHLEKIKTQLEDMERQLNDWKQQRQECLQQASLLSRLEKAFGPRGVQSFVLQNAIGALETSSQYYLQDLSDGTLKLHLQLDSTSSSGGERIVRTVSTRSDGDASSTTWTERPLSSLSGGQWRRCSLALAFGFANLVALRGQLRPSLWVLDEPLTHLDFEGRAQVARLLRQLLSSEDGATNKASCRPSTILVILQDLAADEMQESFHAMDEVTRQSGHSTVHVDDGCGGGGGGGGGVGMATKTTTTTSGTRTMTNVSVRPAAVERYGAMAE